MTTDETPTVLHIWNEPHVSLSLLLISQYPERTCHGILDGFAYSLGLRARTWRTPTGWDRSVGLGLGHLQGVSSLPVFVGIGCWDWVLGLLEARAAFECGRAHGHGFGWTLGLGW